MVESKGVGVRYMDCLYNLVLFKFLFIVQRVDGKISFPLMNGNNNDDNDVGDDLSIIMFLLSIAIWHCIK